MEKVRIGVIGAGYWGPNLIRNFVELQSSELVGVADLKEDRLNHIKASYPQVEVTSDYRDLFNMGVDAIVIATPPATHYKIARDCLAHGRHVLVEKPITLRSVDAEDLINLSQQKKLTLMVGHTFEYNAAVRALRELVASGELGEIYYVDSARLNLGLFQNGLNVLWDLAPHDISILTYILNLDPISVSAQGMHCVFNHIHDVAYINVVFPNNILAHVHVSWLDPCKVRRVTVVGSRKMVVYNDLASVEKIKIYDKSVEVPEYTDTYAEFQCSYHYGDVLIPNIRFTEPLRLECQDFLDSIVNQTTPQSSAANGLKVVQVLEAAQNSLMNGSHQEKILC